ncbi:pseudouridine synthase [Nanoarchaeota archaeon]
MAERVQKIISNAGMMSRRKAEDMIADGKVTVNGKVIGLGDQADRDKDVILVDGKKVELGKKLYIAFNKPGDCLTTLDDPRGRKTVFSYIPFKTRLIPCGRLDFKTEGLLLLTNDGDFANKIMHPRYEVKKTYVVWVDHDVSREHIDKLKEGVFLKEFEIRTRPAKVRYGHDKKTLEITIHEGKNRIVRRMLNALGYEVKRLMRIKIGMVDLGNLYKAKYRNLSRKEIDSFK